MIGQALADAAQNRLFRFVLYGLIVCGFIAVISYKTTLNYGYWDASKLDVLERDFHIAVASIITQAQLQGRVQQVQLQDRVIQVNRKGQPVAFDAQGRLDCKALWQQVMGFPLGQGSSLTSELIKVNSAGQSVMSCRFLTGSGRFWDYAPELKQ